MEDNLDAVVDMSEELSEFKIWLIVTLCFIALYATVLRGIYEAMWRIDPLKALGTLLFNYLGGYLVTRSIVKE